MPFSEARTIYVAHRCPTCGAPLQLDDESKCLSCSTRVVQLPEFSESGVLTRSDAVAPPSHETVLSVEQLRTYFFTNDGVVRAVNGVSFSVKRGETLGIVGESGCGKSITALSIMGLLGRPGRCVGGRVLLNERNLLELTPDQMEEVRGNDVAMIFQEPMTALNPVQRVGFQVAESLRRHLGLSGADAQKRVIELFEKVRIPSPRSRVKSYPHELSGGLRQRVMIAMALACNPKVLIADEPTTALDVTIQAQILSLIDELKRTDNMAVILITHDLGVIAEVAEHVAVMYAGRIVERAPVADIFEHPQHPYTRGLLSSIPSPDKLGQKLSVIKGMVPHPLNLPSGCAFAPRCPSYLGAVCDAAVPALMPTSKTQSAACYLHGTLFEEIPEPDEQVEARATAMAPPTTEAAS